jgi:cytochrome c oxidase subunit 2
MLATIRVVDQAEFDAWVSNLQAEEAARAEAEAQLGEAALRGAELSVTTGCTACHNISGEPGGVGPTWLGLFGSEREFVDGSTAVADEDYIRSSILNPNDQVLAGYVQGLMPQTYDDTLSDEQIDDLVEYIKSLGGE